MRPLENESAASTYYRMALNSRTKLPYLPFLPLLEGVSDAIIVARPDPWRLVYANPASAAWLDAQVEESEERRLALRGFGAAEQWRGDIDSFWHGDADQASLAIRSPVEGERGRKVLSLCRLDFDGERLLGLVIRSSADWLCDLREPEPERRDPLTELPDRTFLLSRMTALMRSETSHDRRFAVLFVDLDNFKQVNDAQGHLIGDRVLREVARRLVHCVREGDHVARFGGDEFVVLVERVGALKEVESIIHRIHAVLAKPIVLPKGDVTLSVSVGAAEASPEHHTPEDILAAADRAMYASKRMHG